MKALISNPEFADQLTLSAAKCQVCKGSSFQAPPALHIGNPLSRILIIGQNPAAYTPKSTPPDVLERAAVMFAAKSGAEVAEWYREDYTQSRAYKRLTEVFGGEWLDRYMFTNAVLCRTPGNASPSLEMSVACSVWTNMLARGKSAFVFIGRTAAEQMLGETGRTVKDGELKKWRGSLIFFMYHTSSREWNTELSKKYARVFQRLTEKVDKEF